MDRKKLLKISPYVLLIIMSIFTVLFFVDIKFVVVGLNIIDWDILAAATWIFIRLCKWAHRKHTGRRAIVVAVITLTEFLVASVMLIDIYGKIPYYVGKTEPKTHRTFVVECKTNLMLRGSAKLYERFGPLLFPCDVEEYSGEISSENPKDRDIYISEDGTHIVVAYFSTEPIFSVPLE